MAQEGGNKYNTASRTLLMLTIAFTIASIVLVGRIVYIRWFWEPNPKALKMKDFKVQSLSTPLAPRRGDILDCNGKTLATSVPRYDIEIDCKVQWSTYKGQTDKLENSNKTKGAANEEEWKSDLKAFIKGLVRILDDGRSAEKLEKDILRRRESTDPDVSKTIRIASSVDYKKMLEIKKLPLARRNTSEGGVKFNVVEERDYPYGELARRTLGYVKNNIDCNRAKGIEGSYNYELHGSEGIEWKKMVDDKTWVKDTDSTSVEPVNGRDIKLTLDIDIQDLADRALRRQVIDDENIRNACMIVMEVKTGAVKAMVNLHRDKNGKVDESLSIALKESTEPGSVFKTVGLMTLLDDNKVRLSTRIPTNHGVLQNFKTDRHIADYERQTKRNTISVLEGLEMSSNYVFAYLAIDKYKDNPKEFLGRYYDYGFGSNWEFDIKGMARCQLPDPNSKRFSITDIGSLAYGYSAHVTPLHTLTFYNAIANNGALVKPWIVEQVLEYGKPVKTFRTEYLNRSICKQSTRDSLVRALRSVVTNGTGSKLKSAKCSVAGKTGTARMILEENDSPSPSNPYISTDGKMRNQGSFVGFFPAEDPVYSAIVVVYSGLSEKSYYGGSRPAEAFREVVDGLYAMRPEWRTVVSEESGIPAMQTRISAVGRNDPDIVPDVMGLGLNEAIYKIENSGYRCRFEGVGHVQSQSPQAGKDLQKGGTISIRLE